MRIRLRTHDLQLKPPCDPEPEIFRSIATHAPSRWLSTLTSLAAHLVVLGLLSVLARETSQRENKIDWSRYTVETLRLQVPDPIYFRASGPHPAASTGAGRRLNTGRPDAAAISPRLE